MGFITFLINAVKRIITALFGSGSTPAAPPADGGSATPGTTNPSGGNYEPKIVRVSDTMESGRVGDAKSTITLKSRKGTIYFATYYEVVGSFYVGLKIDGSLMETDSHRNTLILYEVELPSSGRELARNWNPPYPNGYQVGTHQAEFLLYNGNRKLVQTLPFTLVVEA